MIYDLNNRPIKARNLESFTLSSSPISISEFFIHRVFEVLIDQLNAELNLALIIPHLEMLCVNVRYASWGGGVQYIPQGCACLGFLYPNVVDRRSDFRQFSKISDVADYLVSELRDKRISCRIQIWYIQLGHDYLRFSALFPSR